MTLYDKLAGLNRVRKTSRAATRIVNELIFASEISTAHNHAYDSLTESAVDALLAHLEQDGVLTNTACMEVEKMLMPLSEIAKSYRVHCLSHAHIDMNWMWGYQETAAVTVDTFRTILDLMKEYPTFTFGQSQASTYEIIEKNAPSMIEEIKKYVKEGRWDVSASTWVETDKNMPNGESLSRHILYTKRYLSKLLDLDPTSLELDFEPDTFGHNISVPEICNQGGVKYYYHCRGNGDDSNLCAYRWRARSGAELLVWREPLWYNAAVDASDFRKVPQLYLQNKINTCLYLYGVGDHGGGPTRRDVERLLDIATWPIMPTIFFSTYSAFFHELEACRDQLPIREGEMNFVFTGCYTSQSRIKMANRLSEDRMYESEMLGATANLLGGGPRYNESFGEAWKNILFNHFHDILPGSGKVETREYAMGLFQRTMATIGTNANCAMRTMAEAIDTSMIPTTFDPESTSEGSGVGINSFSGMPQTERGMGKTRILHLFNTTQTDFDGVTVVKVWDWNYDAGRAVFADSNGNKIPSELVNGGSGYWAHTFKEFAIRVKIPALGYATVTLTEAEIAANDTRLIFEFERTDPFTDDDMVLENNLIRAVFSRRTAQMISLFDKRTGKELLKEPSATLRLIQEGTTYGMTAWRVGKYMKIENLNETCSVTIDSHKPYGLRNGIVYHLSFGQRSSATVRIHLTDNSDTLDFELTVDFHEVGSAATSIPQLNFLLPLGYAAKAYRYDVPFGTLDRPDIRQDVPANSFAVGLPATDGDPACMLITDSKYGFRGADNSLAIDLIRGSYDPDPYPEYGLHTIRIGVAVPASTAPTTLYATAATFIHPISFCSTRSGAGTLPLDGKLLTLDGEVRLSAVKTPEDCDGLIVRLSDACGNGSAYTLSFAKTPVAAFETDLNENPIAPLSIENGTVVGTAKPYGVHTILVQF